MLNPTSSSSLPSSCGKAYQVVKEDRFPILLAVGTIVLLGGLFLTLSAYQVLPNGVNAISNLGLGGPVIGFMVITLGCALFVAACMMNRCQHRQKPEEPAIVQELLNQEPEEPAIVQELLNQEPEEPAIVQEKLKALKTHLNTVSNGVRYAGSYSTTTTNVPDFLTSEWEYKEVDTFSLTKANVNTLQHQIEAKAEKYSRQGRPVFIRMDGSTQKEKGAITCTLYLRTKQ